MLTAKAMLQEYQTTTDLRQLLDLLLLANFGDHTPLALLAAAFAERTLLHAGKNAPIVTRCVTAVRAWANDPTAANKQECKDAHAHASAAASAASAASATAAESKWQLVHVRQRYPLTEL